MITSDDVGLTADGMGNEWKEMNQLLQMECNLQYNLIIELLNIELAGHQE